MPLRRVWQVAGHGGLIMRNLPNESAAYWPDGAYSPREPGGTMQDRNGWCMGNHEKRHSCLRDLHIADPRGGAATRFSYQFLTQSNSTWELGLSGRQLGDRAPDFAFVQCPQYEYFKPDAYDYTLSKEERAKPSNRMMGPEHLAVDRAIIESIGRASRDEEMRVKLYKNLVIVGGGSLMSGFVEALQGRVLHALPARDVVETVDVVRAAELDSDLGLVDAVEYRRQVEIVERACDRMGLVFSA